MTVIFEKPYCQTKKTAIAVIFFGGSVLFYSSLRIFELVDGKGNV
jgi:hypothetical protein